ncbi:phosphate signaling complex protein PhoU [Microbacter margulisiae]|uniref:Phosphate transport system protein n=1 Tax=Microbacter margulisiae TaxID=1350067 RepID=A0A7W5DSF9_9PORP|nr:phosphate signaling complex protein PhoU [Microbacter margulisiae]MBB3188232.1 phosphate transport system protein [Microbacter margulisiae]
MNTQKENALHDIREKFNDLSQLVLYQLDLLEKIINKGDPSIPDSLLEELNANEADIDLLEIQLGEEIIDTIVLQQPMASDLRQVIAINQMVSNLERIGDLVMNIVYFLPRIQNVEIYSKMSEVMGNMLMTSVSMVKRAIQSFTMNDKEDAIWTIKNDAIVDEMNRKLIKKTITRSNLPEETQQLLFAFINLNNIISNIERVGDHATNIAESSIYALEGKDLRHKKLENE